MSSTQSTSQVDERGEVIKVGHDGLTALVVGAGHGVDWFPVQITSGLHQTVLYLRREQLHALRCRLDEIDEGMPAVEEAIPVGSASWR